MSDIIKNGRVHADEWTVLRLAEGDEATTIALPAGRVIVPLAVWQARREELLPKAEAGVLGVWLAGNENPAALTADLSALPLVAVDFPKFADGRGYSIATLLRTRLGYGGELRAIGNVLRDQFFFLLRCGFQRAAAAGGQVHAGSARRRTRQPERLLRALPGCGRPTRTAVPPPIAPPLQGEAA